MQILSRGEVITFLPNKGYGFVILFDDKGQPTGEEVFFHANDFGRFGLAKRGVIFVRGGGEDAVMPKEGDVLIFKLVEPHVSRSHLRKGRPKAMPWGFACQYDQLVHEQAGTRCRVVSDTADPCACRLVMDTTGILRCVIEEGKLPTTLAGEARVELWVPELLSPPTCLRGDWKTWHGGWDVIQQAH